MPWPRVYSASSDRAPAGFQLGPRRVAFDSRSALTGSWDRETPGTTWRMRVRALLSVATRDGITVFARGLQSLGVELYATDGTREHLAQDGVEVRPVADLTGVPTML